MKRLIKIALLFLTSFACVLAQNPASSEQRAEELRTQLRVLIDKEAELQTRLQQLDDDLKPENIQRSIALIGTTRPADLREQRRLQLEKEKTGVQSQLEQLAVSRARLEASIATAEAEADRERTQANTPPPPTATRTTPPLTKPSSAPPAVVRQQPPAKRQGKRLRRSRARRRTRSD